MEKIYSSNELRKRTHTHKTHTILQTFLGNKHKSWFLFTQFLAVRMFLTPDFQVVTESSAVFCNLCFVISIF